MAHFPLSIAWRTWKFISKPWLGLDIVNAAQHAWTSNGVGHIETPMMDSRISHRTSQRRAVIDLRRSFSQPRLPARDLCGRSSVPLREGPGSGKNSP